MVDQRGGPDFRNQFFLAVFADVKAERLADAGAEVVQPPESREQEDTDAHRQQHARQPVQKAAAAREDADECIEQPEDRESRQHLPERDRQQRRHRRERRERLARPRGIERKDKLRRVFRRREHQPGQNQKNRGQDRPPNGFHEISHPFQWELHLSIAQTAENRNCFLAVRLTLREFLL